MEINFNYLYFSPALLMNEQGFSGGSLPRGQRFRFLPLIMRSQVSSQKSPLTNDAMVTALHSLVHRSSDKTKGTFINAVSFSSRLHQPPIYCTILLLCTPNLCTTIDRMSRRHSRSSVAAEDQVTKVCRSQRARDSRRRKMKQNKKAINC